MVILLVGCVLFLSSVRPIVKNSDFDQYGGLGVAMLVEFHVGPKLPKIRAYMWI